MTIQLRPELARKFKAQSHILEERLEALMPNLLLPDHVDEIDWIEKNVVIPSTVSSSGGVPIELFGYQKGIVRLIMRPTTKKWLGLKAIRTGITQLMTGVAALGVGHFKLPVGWWQPTEDDAKAYYSDYWYPTITESETLSKLQRKPMKGESMDRWNWMQLTNGGKMQIKFASSDDQFRRDTLAWTFGDELDGEGWRAGKKGSQGNKPKLMWGRSHTFYDRKQMLWSSPLDEETSNTWALWLESDQRRWFVRCPHCDEVWYFKWGNPKKDGYGFDADRDENGYVTHVEYVAECGCIIQESELPGMDAEAGEVTYDDDNAQIQDERLTKRLGWQPTKIPKQPGLVGCHIPGYISLFAGSSWKQIMQEWIDAQGDPEKLQTFVNNTLGEPWRNIEIGKQIDVGSYEHRRPVSFPAEIPDWVLYLTAYIDIQEGWLDEEKKLRPRFEIQIVGWGKGMEAAQIGHFVLQDHDLFAPEMLQQMDEIVFRKWERADGSQLQIVMCGVDASHRQTEALAMCRAKHRLQVFRAMKGEAETAREKAPIIINAPKPTETKNTLIRVGTRRAKDLANRLVRNESPGPYHLHIPRSIGAAVDTDDGRPPFFESLFAEKRVLKSGVETWVRKSKMNTGEVWDCLVGNVATIELAMLTYPKRVGREVNDMTVQPPRDRYESEDHSVMSEVLAARQLKDFEGDATLSILPPRGEVNLPDHLVSATPIAVKRRAPRATPKPAPTHPRMRPNPLLQAEQTQASTGGGMQVRRRGLEVRRTRI